MPVVNLEIIHNRILSLKRFIHYCDERYFLYNESPIHDSDYDLLVEELKNLQQYWIKNFQSLNISNAQSNKEEEKIFSDLQDNQKKEQHIKPMLSLQKVYEIEDLVDFFHKSKNDLLLEMKIDGISISLIYENGLLIQALTRGDGEFGERIFFHVLEIKDIPLILKLNKNQFLLSQMHNNFMGNNTHSPMETKEDNCDKEKNHINELIQEDIDNLKKNSNNNLLSGKITIRGELYIKKSTHKNFFSHNIHPRNICAGLIRRKYPDQDTGKINFFAYSILGLKELKTQEETLDILKELKFPVEPNYSHITQVCDLEKAIEHWKKEIPNLDYECDGIVLKVNELLLQQSMGYTNRHPRGALAFKFANERKSTFLLSIQWQVGTNGTITPVGHINPVRINKVLIQKVTLHNYDFVKNLNSVNIIVERAGGVIPKVIKIPLESVESKLNKINFEENDNMIPRENRDFLTLFPEKCPCCNNPLLQTEKDLICTNYLNCKDQILGRLIKFCQKLNLYGIGKKQMQILLDQQIIQTYYDICTIAVKCKITPHPKISQLIWDKFIEQIKKIKKDSKIISCITLCYGGDKTMEKIAQLIWDKEEILNYTVEELTTYFIVNKYFTPKIAEIIGQSMVIFAPEIIKLLHWIRTN